MQYTSKEIYKEVSEENNIPLNKVKLIGDIVFDELSKKIKSPNKIIIKIKGLGSFFLRKRKLENFIQSENTKGELTDFKLVETLEARLKEYEIYVQKKQKMQKLRRNGEIIKPVIEEE